MMVTATSSLKMRRRNGNAVVCELIIALGCFITATACCVVSINEVGKG